jgi:SAM-dependent methyltransferase
MTQTFDAQFWDQRYAVNDFVFGTEPNEFLRQVAEHIPPGPVLCLAEGEGRNAVFLAERGHAVTAVDQSDVGMRKAAALAATRGVPLTTVVGDLTDYDIPAGAWAGIVVIFMHLPPELRNDVLTRAVEGLRPGGVIVLECYTPAQLAYNTGGPKNQDLLPTLTDLRIELGGLEFLIAQEIERDVIEGGGHTGRGAVVQVLARRPASGR